MTTSTRAGGNMYGLAQNDGQSRELDVTGTNMRTDEKTAQTGAGGNITE